MKYSVKQFLLNELFASESVDDMFSDFFDKEKNNDRGSVVKTEFITEPYTLTLYRGFNADLDSLEKVADSYVLSPKKSEQGMIWFTHIFIRGYNPIEYAKSHGSLLLTFPLEVKKHYKLTTYDNGEQVEEAPERILNLIDETENQPYMCLYNEFCLELPSGWVFTYKNEKFIGTTNKLLVKPNMIEKIGSNSDY